MIEQCTKTHLQKPARWQKCNCIELAEAKHHIILSGTPLEN